MQEPKTTDTNCPKSAGKPPDLSKTPLKYSHLPAHNDTEPAKKYDGSHMMDTREAPDNMPKRRKVGRPTKYRAIFCQQIIAYFDRPHTYEGESIHTNKKGETWTAYQTKANPVPLMCSFAEYINVDTSTLWEWEQNHPEFSKAITRAQDLQLNHLAIVTGLGLYNSNWAVFMAKNISKWRDKKELEHSGQVDSTLFLDNMISKSEGALEDEHRFQDALTQQ